MSRVSGMSEVINLRATPRMNIEGLQDIVQGLFYACKYDEWYFGIVNYVCYENDDVNVKFMYPNGPSTQFFWPNRDDTCWIPLHDMICKVEPPSASSTGRYYQFVQNDIEKVGRLLKAQ